MARQNKKEDAEMDARSELKNLIATMTEEQWQEFIRLLPAALSAKAG